VGDRQDLVEVVDVDDPEDEEATESLLAAQPRSPTSTSTAFDCVGYELGSLLDARQKQPSTESYGGNIQIGWILGSMKTTYECRCYGCLANYPLKTWLDRQKWTFSEFARCARAGAKVEKFSSTWSMRSVSMTAPRSLKIT